MPREIPLRQMPPISGGVLIKHAQLRRQRQALDIVAAARREALVLVKQAQTEAGDISRQAFSEGYQEGVIAAAESVAEYFAETQRLGVELQDIVNQHARQLLSSALNHPDRLLEMVDEWLETLPPPAATESMTLIMPENARRSHVRIKQRIEAAWPGACSIEYHDDSRFMMKYGHQMAEFSPEEVLAEGLQRLCAIGRLPDDCRRLSESGLRRLHEIFLQHYAVDNTERE